MSTPNTIRKYYEFNTTESHGHFGLELETEYNKDELAAINAGIPVGWTVKGDSSLRHHGVEFVTVGACRLDTKDKLIDDLGALLKRLSVKLDSPRTSFHVHINVADRTPLEIYTALTAYWLLEEMLFTKCDKYRRGNLHCLSLKEAPGALRTVMDSAKRGDYFYHTSQQNTKYGAVNVGTIRRYGTLEFRMLDGRTNADILKLWTDILYSIVENSAKNFKHPKDVLDKLYEEVVLKPYSGVSHAFIKKYILPEDEHVKWVLSDVPKPREWLIEAGKRLYSLAYGPHNWESPGKTAPLPKPKRADRTAAQVAAELYAQERQIIQRHILTEGDR